MEQDSKTEAGDVAIPTAKPSPWLVGLALLAIGLHVYVSLVRHDPFVFQLFVGLPLLLASLIGVLAAVVSVVLNGSWASMKNLVLSLAVLLLIWPAATQTMITQSNITIDDWELSPDKQTYFVRYTDAGFLSPIGGSALLPAWGKNLSRCALPKYVTPLYWIDNTTLFVQFDREPLKGDPRVGNICGVKVIYSEDELVRNSPAIEIGGNQVSLFVSNAKYEEETLTISYVLRGGDDPLFVVWPSVEPGGSDRTFVRHDLQEARLIVSTQIANCPTQQARDNPYGYQIYQFGKGPYWGHIKLEDPLTQTEPYTNDKQNPIVLAQRRRLTLRLGLVHRDEEGQQPLQYLTACGQDLGNSQVILEAEAGIRIKGTRESLNGLL